jgi:hypothetical protein
MAAMGQAAGGGEGQAQGAGQGEGQGQPQGGPDLSGLVEQIGTIASGQEEMRQFLASNPWAAQAGQEEAESGGELDLSFLDPAANVYENPDAVAERLNQTLNGVVDQRTQAAVAPIQQQMVEMRRDQQARDLAAEFPELAEPDMAKKVAGPGGLAVTLAEQLGRPELAAEPSFWRLAYMANKAAEAANAEQGSGDPGAAHLESGNGAGPGLTEADLVKQIAESGGRGSRVLDF